MGRWQQEEKVHMNNTVRQYEYVMEGTEIREFYLAAGGNSVNAARGYGCVFYLF